MNQAEVQAEAIVKEVTARLDNICYIVADKSSRYEESFAAGGVFAAEVRRYLENPEAVGTDALYAAYNTYMQRHAGNFTPLCETAHA